MAKIGIVTVLYNSASVLEDYFKTLSEQTFKDFVLYVIDNKSPDDSLALSYKYAEQYKDSYKTVIIENDDNFGVANGNNIGTTRAIADGCDYILLSNNDVVLDSSCIEKLLNHLENSDDDMVVPKIFYFGEKLLWAAGGKFNWLRGSTNHFGILQKDSSIFNVKKRIDYAPTCFMLIKAKTFNDVGMFDERYFVYYDDTDWVYRCREKRKKLIYLPDAVMWHKESTSTGGMLSNFYLHFNTRNRYYYCKKHFSSFHIFVVVLVNTLFFISRYYSLTKQQRKIIIDSFFEGIKY